MRRAGHRSDWPVDRAGTELPAPFTVQNPASGGRVSHKPS